MALPAISFITAAIPDFLSLPQKTTIGGIDVDTAIEQTHSDRTTATRHPVQAGAPMTDHVYNEPAQLVLRCGWSNSHPNADDQGFAGFFDGGSSPAATYIDGIYSKLLQLRAERKPFAVATIRRNYDTMVFEEITLHVDDRTSQALMVEATLQEIIVTNTSSTTLPPMENQKVPASTAETQKTGTTQVQPATPAPGGSNPAPGWGPSLISR